MIAGMLPMALGLGEAGQQNAPLGRAVIGGLIAATAGHACSCCPASSLWCKRAASTRPRRLILETIKVRIISRQMPELNRDGVTQSERMI